MTATPEPLPRYEFESDDLLVRLDLTLPADLDAISPVVEGVLRIVQEMGCAAGREFEIELALREALANAIEHGCGNDPSKLPSPIVGQNLFSTGGRGIYLISQLMDEVRFERGGTEIHMRTHPPAAPRA